MTPHPCGHPDGCDQPATHQATRPATEQETAAHWDGLELNIRSSGNPDYVQDRAAAVTVAEHRCDHPDHAHPGHLEALAAAETADAGAMVTVQLTAEQHRQLLQLLNAPGN